ncbi:DNA ligase/mRNA capping enzyme, catalytic [Glarea lozoyensis ATCC 20868]|uniref:DNA ligase/mRNA capping enzyme, catalytic n=1 Tax=Glarea lozoyensis (strain ATCC 20868 / MF5171) TaxID=1116229 RepID=S3CL29_GLAL2|nr:DNA ligase/mRNA capping enzyme, catalytic [Glarea lozoyensis ATCC 20868]EPE26470.1 DNA ligase/mRNA capping enzyme, catalytic [Glarea lozoyensis ATCC 20868]
MAVEITEPTADFNIEVGEESAPHEPSTLFPKIGGNMNEFVQNYHFHTKHISTVGHNALIDTKANTIVPLIGTVKLHGTHADLVVYSNDKILIQSRNLQELTAEHDNLDTYKMLAPLRPEILKLRDRYHARFKELNPTTPIEDSHPTIIAGEWVGPKIQKRVALAQLEKRVFVILCVSINNKWLSDMPYQDIHDEENGFYNVSKGGFYHNYIDINDHEGSKKRLQIPTLEVEKECPFTKTFNISGMGEGIVWKTYHPLGADAKFWIKTKGHLHRVTDHDKITEHDAKQSQKEKVGSFVEATVTENRLVQGWDYMAEMGHVRDKMGVQVFIGWVYGDIMEEERSLLAEMELVEFDVRNRIGGAAARWYLEKLKTWNAGEEEGL